MVHEPKGIIAAVERQVLVLQPAQVAQHFGLAVVALEHRVGEEGALPAERPGQARLDRAVELVDVERRCVAAEDRPEGQEIFPPGGLVQGDAEVVGVDAGGD